MYNRGSGLGLAPVVAAGLVSLGSKVAGFLFAPDGATQLQQAARSGNIVAWWQLKAYAGSLLPVRGTFNGVQVAASGLTREEQEGLVAALGPGALADNMGQLPGTAGYQRPAGNEFQDLRVPLRNKVMALYAEGAGDQLDRQSAATLQASAPAGALAGAPPWAKWALAGVVGWIVFDLFRR